MPAAIECIFNFHTQMPQCICIVAEYIFHVILEAWLSIGKIIELHSVIINLTPIH